MDAILDTVVVSTENAVEALYYPATPTKPVKDLGETNAAYGARLDEYDLMKQAHREAVVDYREGLRRIEDVFKKNLLAALGVEKHPNADKMYQLAWAYGHSSGYREVANYAEDLATLLK